MKYIINALLISFLYLNSIAFAIGEKKELSALEKMGQYTAEGKLQQAENDLQVLFKKYNKARRSPKEMIKLYSVKDQPFMAQQIGIAGIKSFPKMSKIKNDYVIKIDGHSVRVNAVMLIKGYVQVDGKKYLIDSNNGAEEVFNDIQQLLGQKTSLVNLLINDAQALLPLVKLIIIVGAVALISYLVFGTKKNIDNVLLLKDVKKYIEKPLEKVEKINDSFTRVKEIAKICEDDTGNNEIVRSVKEGAVTEDNAIVHYLLKKVDDRGAFYFNRRYDSEELIEAFSNETSDNCSEYAEEIRDGVFNVIFNKRVPEMYLQPTDEYDEPTGPSLLTRARLILENHNCEERYIGLPGKKQYKRDDVEKNIYKCIKKSCDNLVAKHDTCLKDIYERTTRSNRNSRASEAEGKIDWSRKVVVPKTVPK